MFFVCIKYGSLIAWNYFKKYDYELDGLIICGSPVKSNEIPFIKKLCKIIERVKGDHYRSTFIHKIIHGMLENWLTHAENELDEFINDDGCGFIFTINGFENLCNLMSNVYNKKNWIKRNPNL